MGFQIGNINQGIDPVEDDCHPFRGFLQGLIRPLLYCFVLDGFDRRE